MKAKVNIKLILFTRLLQRVFLNVKKRLGGLGADVELRDGQTLLLRLENQICQQSFLTFRFRYNSVGVQNCNRLRWVYLNNNNNNNSNNNNSNSNSNNNNIIIII